MPGAGQHRRAAGDRLGLIAAGPAQISAANSQQIAAQRRQVAQDVAALDLADTARRTALAAHFAKLADWAEQKPGAPWQELAAELRAEAARLREG